MSPREPGPPWWAEERGPSHRKPAARGAGARRAFGKTWWGQAWVEALEHRAALDRNRLPRGRGYARSGSVSDLDISPGVVHASVQGSRAKPYSVTVRVRAFDASEWERVLDAVAVQIGRTAALLDGELPPELVDDVAAAGLSLLPGAGEVQPRCSCPDWADPCKHSAAVCYLVADELDVDPFALLRLRGRDRDELLAMLRARRSGDSKAAASPLDDRVFAVMPARDAYARALGELPAVPLPPSRPGRPTVLPVEPPAGSGVRSASLAALAADATARAWELVNGDDGGLGLDVDADLARRASRALGPALPGMDLATMARNAGMPARQLASWALAWKHGVTGGFEALRGSWQPKPDELDDGRAALAASSDGRRVSVQRNRVTCGPVQLRLGQDGLWYRFVRSGNVWDLAGPGAPDPERLI